MQKDLRKHAGIGHSKSQSVMIAMTFVILIVFYGIFMVFPIGYAAVGSFFDWRPSRGQFDFIGFKNYVWLFTNKTTLSSLGNTLYFTVVVVIFRTLTGLIFAALINEISHGKALYRTLFFLPVITSTVAVALVWNWLYEPATGPLNYYLGLIGVPRLSWLKDKNLAMPSVMLMTVWKDMGYALVVYMAGMTGIPHSLYESASIDGCNRFKSFFHITLPMLKPTTTFVLITSIISYCQTFTQIDLMTEGGPGKATYTLVYMLYQEAFKSNRFGRASAISFLLFAIILVMSILQLKTNNKEVA